MNKIFKTISGMFIIMMLAKVLGQAREMLLAGYYGTGAEASAFLTSSQLPLNFFDMILGLAIVSAFVPVFNEYYQTKGKAEANNFANNFIGIVLIISLVVVVLGVIFSDYIIGIQAAGFDENTAKLASRLLKIMFPSLIFTAIAYSYAGVVQSYGEFKLPAAMSIASNLVAILYFIFFANKFGIYGLAIAMLIGWALQLLILIPALVKFKHSFGISFDFLHPGMKKVYKLALPILLSSWVQPLNIMFNQYLASFIDGGNAVSYINYANKLYIIIVGVFTMSVTNLILPKLSKLFAEQNYEESISVITLSVKSTILFIFPVMIIFLMYSQQIIEFVYMRGAFDKNSATMTALTLFFYSFGMIGYGLQEILNKSFYSMQNSTTPMKNAFLTIGVNILLSIVLCKFMGVGGLALASAIASTVSAVNLSHKFKKEFASIEYKPIFVILFKSALASILSGIVSKLLFIKFAPIFNGGFLIEVAFWCICALIAFVIYVILLYILRVKELNYIIVKKGCNN